MSLRSRLLVIIVLVLTAIYIDLPATLPINIHVGPVNITNTLTRPPINLKMFGISFTRDLTLKQGLDLQGGAEIVLEADMENVEANDRITALESAKEVINRRIDLFGVSEPVVQTNMANDRYRIIAELPGITNVSEALDLIGTTAQLDFRQLNSATTSATLADFIPTGLTGKNLKRSRVEFDPNTGTPIVSLEFDSQGSEQFAQITRDNIGKPVAIFLDSFPVTIPQVNEAIIGGRAVISGDFTTAEAKTLSIQLNAGALPVPINIIEQKNIGATLGRESVTKSLLAGAIGLAMVMIFMALYYKNLGLIANLALIIYGLLTLAVYKLIPVTLTLPGLAGFILSVGMAVDSNILIFERMKEELRNGKKWHEAMELGFGRAWDSIKDANTATLITAFILFNPLNWDFLNRSGTIRGFALTLTLGILISLFTGVVVTRTLIRTLYQSRDYKRK